MVLPSMTSNTQRNCGRRVLSIPITPRTQDSLPHLTNYMSSIACTSARIRYYGEWNGLWGRHLWITILDSTRKNLETYLPHMCSTHPKKIQYLARAMHLKASVNDDNIAIIKNLEPQIGTSPEWYQSFVRLCHGDLGTQERHDAMTESWAIKFMRQEWLQFLVTIPGGFHICMACVDAIWWVHIQSKALHEVKGGIFDQFKVLCPKDSSKLASHPTYHMLNDGIQHLMSSHILVCWEQATGFADLRGFAKREPPWLDIVEFLERICINRVMSGNVPAPTSFRLILTMPDTSFPNPNMRH